MCKTKVNKKLKCIAKELTRLKKIFADDDYVKKHVSFAINIVFDIEDHLKNEREVKINEKRRIGI